MTMSRLVIAMLLLNILIAAGGLAMNIMLFRSGGAMLAGQRGEMVFTEAQEYEFYPVEKIIVSLRNDGRERYFVLDLMLLAKRSDTPKRFEPVEPIVRNSVVSYLSGLKFDELRSLQIAELQARLEEAVRTDFNNKRIAMPFEQVLVSKLIVQ